MFHAEVVHRDGRSVGSVRSASYGHTLGGAVGLAMVESDRPITPEALEGGTWTVEVAGRHVPARVSLRPLYDPTNARILR
jgi:glycine cleavage system aminomethyltransferase T